MFIAVRTARAALPSYLADDGPICLTPSRPAVFSMPSSDAVSQPISAQEEEKITEKLVASLL